MRTARPIALRPLSVFLLALPFSFTVGCRSNPTSDNASQPASPANVTNAAFIVPTKNPATG